MTHPGYSSSGGPGGIYAHTVDMDHAAGVIDRACREIEVARGAIAAQLGYASTAARVSLGHVTHTPAWRAEQSLHTVNDWKIGLPAIEQELEDLAHRVRLATEHYLEAERANQLRVSALQQSWRSLQDGIATDVWARRHAAGFVWDFATIRAPLFGFSGAVGDWIKPSGGPPTTGYLNRDSVQSFLGFLDPPGAQPPFGYESLTMYLSSVLLMIRHWSGTDVMTEVEPLPDVRPLPPPTGIADLLGGVFRAHAGHRGVVGIHEVEQADGSSAFIVYIPGTEDWDPNSTNPFNTVSNLMGVVGKINEAMVTTLAAMIAAGIPPEAPVMLAGYSQGGLTATALAASSGFADRFSVTHVATAGSPTGQLPRVDGVNYVHLEVLEDVTPGLDGAANPDRANVTTVEMSLRDSPDPEVAARGRDVEGAHHPQTYLALADLADANPTTSVKAWTDSAGAFLGGDRADYREFQATPQSP